MFQNLTGQIFRSFYLHTETPPRDLILIEHVVRLFDILIANGEVVFVAAIAFIPTSGAIADPPLSGNHL